MLLQAMDMHGGTVGVREAHGRGSSIRKEVLEGVSWQGMQGAARAGWAHLQRGGQEEAWEATWARGPSPRTAWLPTPQPMLLPLAFEGRIHCPPSAHVGGWGHCLHSKKKKEQRPVVGKGLQQLWALTTPLLCPGYYDILVSKPWQCQEDS